MQFYEEYCEGGKINKAWGLTPHYLSFLREDLDFSSLQNQFIKIDLSKLIYQNQLISKSNYQHHPIPRIQRLVYVSTPFNTSLQGNIVHRIVGNTMRV